MVLLPAALAGAAVAWAGCAGEPSSGTEPGFETSGLAAVDAARLNLAVAQDFDHAGHWREAIRHYELARRMDPDAHAWVSRALGRLYAMIGEPARAVEEYAAALRLDPNDVDLLDEIGLFEMGEGAVADAAEHFRRAVEIQPGRKASWVNLGLAHGAQGEYEAAMRAFARAMPAPEARANVALAMGRNGDFPGAAEQMRLAVAGQPELQRYNAILEAMRNERRADGGEDW